MGKQVHHYDKKTREFRGTTPARIDPEETKLKRRARRKAKQDAALEADPQINPEELAAIDLTEEEAEEETVYLVPANATLEEHVEPAAGNVTVFDGGVWDEKEDNRGKTIYNQVTGESQVVDFLGGYPDGWSEIDPELPFEGDEVDIQIDTYINNLTVNVTVTPPPRLVVSC